MHGLLIVLGFLLSGVAWADTSIFHKISVLRFGEEEIVGFEDGSLDLRNLRENEYFHAQGEVYFIPNEFLDATYMDEAAFRELLQSRQAIKANLRLKTYPYPMEGTEATYGTFVMRFMNNKKQRLSIAMPRFFHPTEISFVDPQQMRRLIIHGKLDKDPTRNRNFSEATATVPVIDVEQDFYIFAKVSAPLYKGRNTLNLSTFYIAQEHYLNRLVHSARFYASLISGSFLVIFIFYFFIYSFRPKDRSSLYLCVYALCSFAISIIYIQNLPLTNFQILDVFTTINLFSIAFLQSFLLDKLSFLWSRRTHKILLASAFFVATAGSLGVLTKVMPLIALFFMISFSSSTFLIFATFYLGIKHRLSGITFFLVGAIMNSGFQLPIMIGYILGSNHELGYNIMLANYCMVLSLALVNAKEFAVTYKKSVEQGQALEEKNKEIMFFNKNLEKLVDNKTKEVRALLDYIPQGVLSLAEDGLISKDFSAHLVEILGTREIAHQNFRSLVLDRCEMSSDVRDQAWQAILSIVGEEEFNFEVNAGKLPIELIYKDGDSEKFLRATWNVEVDDGKVIRLLVTLLDATAERELQKEADKQRQELVLIQELLNVSPSKAAQFFSTSLPLLKEIERIILQEQPLTASSVRMLFVNAHTVKGAARTLQFKDLARQIHDMEDYYARILKDGEEIQHERLKQDIAATFAVINRYMDTNRNKLNRSENYSKVVLERDFIEKHCLFIRDLVDDPPKVDSILDWLREQNEALTRLIFEQLPASFDGYKEKAIKIARDLGKADPVFDFNIDDISIPPDQKTVLDNCMVHLLRNALDHGIESPAERKKKGKAEQGMIKVSTAVDNLTLTIRMSDDGRGLAIKKLRAKGEAQNILKAGSSLREVADVIFASGISTAHEVSEISGRGVGMCAVRSFMEKVGGSIHVVLGEPKDEAGEYYDFSFEIQFQRGQAALSRAS